MMQRLDSGAVEEASGTCVETGAADRMKTEKGIVMDYIRIKIRDCLAFATNMQVKSRSRR